MPTVPNTTTIINIAVISEYLASRSIARRNFSGNQPIDKDIALMIYLERKAVQWAYNRNPSDPTLTKTGEYLYALCAPFSQHALNILANFSQLPPVVIGPSNQSVFVGQTAIFSVTVVSALPVTYQWYLNGVIIPGAISASYNFNNAQLTDSGDALFVRVTNSVGTTQSVTAILTVNSALIGYAYSGSTDYSAQLLAGLDNVPYQFSFPISTGQPLSIQFPGPVNGLYIVIKYPISETDKVHYDNLPIDSGPIPNIAWGPIKLINPWKYAFSRTGNPFTLNAANLLKLS